MPDRRTVCLGLGAALAAGAAPAAPRLRRTPHEMLGPFYPIRDPADHDADLSIVRGRPRRARGEVIEIVGRVRRVDGSAVPGAGLRIWQANAAGRYRHPLDTNPAPLDPDFQGSAYLATARDGGFRITTIRPGAYPSGAGRQRTPHIHFECLASDYRLATQMYFPGEPLNDRDELIRGMIGGGRDPQPLFATALPPAADGRRRFEWTIVLR